MASKRVAWVFGWQHWPGSKLCPLQLRITMHLLQAIQSWPWRRQHAAHCVALIANSRWDWIAVGDAISWAFSYFCLDGEEERWKTFHRLRRPFSSVNDDSCSRSPLMLAKKCFSAKKELFFSCQLFEWNGKVCLEWNFGKGRIWMKCNWMFGR